MTKYKLQEMPDVHNTGKRKVYPKIVTNRTLSRKEFIKRMQGYHRGISESTTEAVLLDVADMLVEMLSMGYNVNLEGIGTFSLSLGFEDDKPTDCLLYTSIPMWVARFPREPSSLVLREQVRPCWPRPWQAKRQCLSSL